MEPKASEHQPAVPPAWPSLPAATGDGAVDAVVARLAELAALPVTEQAASYQQIHEALTGALEGEAPEGTPAMGPAGDSAPHPLRPAPAGGARPGPVPGPRRGNA